MTDNVHLFTYVCTRVVARCRLAEISIDMRAHNVGKADVYSKPKSHGTIINYSGNNVDRCFDCMFVREI